MGVTLEDGLRALDEATDLAKTIRIDLDDDYLRAIAIAEALPGIFETVLTEHRVFLIDGVKVPVARLLHIVTSKHTAGRDKDRLFLATHREAFQGLLDADARKSR